MMILRWAGWLLLVIFAGYEAIVFENILASALFAGILLLPVPLMGLLLLQRHYLHAELRVPVPVAEKNGKIQIQIRLSQKKWLPMTCVEADICCISFFTGEKVHYPVTLKADGSHCQYIGELSGSGCGRFRIEISRLRIRDCFRYFYVNKKIRLSEQVTFLPQMYEMTAVISEGTRHFAGETEDYEPEAAGNDPSQIYQIREYRPGDKLQRIHWKLTARNEELFVRESSEPACFAVGIFLDFYRTDKNASNMIEPMIETALSISNALLEQKCRHFFVWYDAKEDRLFKRRIAGLEDLYEMPEYLMSAVIYRQPTDLKVMYRERYPYGLYQVALQLNLYGNIEKEDAVIGNFKARDLEQRLSEILIQV